MDREYSEKEVLEAFDWVLSMRGMDISFRRGCALGVWGGLIVGKTMEQKEFIKKIFDETREKLKSEVRS